MGILDLLSRSTQGQAAHARRRRLSHRRPPSFEGLEDRLVLSQVGVTVSSVSDLNASTTQSVGQLIQQLGNDVSSIDGASTALTPYITQQLNSNYGSLLQPLNHIPYGSGTSGDVNAQLSFQAKAAINTTQLAANEMLSVYTGTLISAGAAYSSSGGTINFYDGQSFNYQSVQNQLNQAFDTFRTNVIAAQNALLSGGGTVGGTTIHTSSDLSGYVSANISQLVTQVQSALSAVPNASANLTPSVVDEINGQHAGSALLPVLNAIPYDTAASAGIDAAYAADAAVAINTSQLAINEMLSVATMALLGSGAAVGSSDGTITLLNGQSYNFVTVQNQLNQDFNTFRTNYFTQQNAYLSGSVSTSVS